MANTNKTALITGSTRGIGLEIGRQLAEHGFQVWLSGRDARMGRNEAEKMSKHGLAVEFVRMDVRSLASIEKAFELIHNDCKRLDVLVNNAAIQPDSYMDLLDVPLDVTQDIFRTNVLGPLYVTQMFASLLKKGSRIINITSTGGQLTTGMGDWAAVYCISKAALNALTIQLSRAMRRRGVAVNCVSPGWVRTDMGGPDAPRSVEQGAETPVWLATEAPHEQTGLHWQDKKVVAW